MTDPVTDYALKVLDGKIPAGPYVVWACQRHMEDLKRDDIYLDLEAVHLRVNFFKLLKHYKDEFYGRPIELEPWQIFRIGSVFGWKWSETDLRRYRVSFNKVPRKNGKTTEMAGIGLAGMVLDGVPGAEVYSVATRRDQAKIVFNDAKEMVGACSELSKRLTRYQSSIVFESKASKWMPLSKESRTLDGLNPYYGLYDEFAMWRDGELRGKIRQGMGARKEPLEWIVTTEGTEIESPCCDLTDHAISVLNPDMPDFKDDTLFAYLACPFPKDDPGSMIAWERANPNLGVSKSVKNMQELWDVAEKMPSEMNDFLTYQLNILVGSSEKWLPIDKWRECGGEVVKESLIGQKCYAGLDLALKNDLSALVLIFPEIKPIPVLPFFWCPAEDIKTRSRNDKVPYDQWARDGYITATPGNATDFSFIKTKILEVCEIYQVEELLYDRHLAHPVVQRLIDEGIVCVGYGQGYISQNGSLREIERLMISRGINHGNHPILDWNATNALVTQDSTGNIKLYKKDPRRRIDGLAGLSNAVGGYLLNKPSEKANPYETRGIDFI